MFGTYLYNLYLPEIQIFIKLDFILLFSCVFSFATSGNPSRGLKNKLSSAAGTDNHKHKAATTPVAFRPQSLSSPKPERTGFQKRDAVTR